MLRFLIVAHCMDGFNFPEPVETSLIMATAGNFEILMNQESVEESSMFENPQVLEVTAKTNPENDHEMENKENEQSETSDKQSPIQIVRIDGAFIPAAPKSTVEIDMVEAPLVTEKIDYYKLYGYRKHDRAWFGVGITYLNELIAHESKKLAPFKSLLQKYADFAEEIREHEELNFYLASDMVHSIGYEFHQMLSKKEDIDQLSNEYIAEKFRCAEIIYNRLLERYKL